MTYEEAAKALVAAGLLDEANAASVPQVLDSTSVEFTYSAWAEALAKAGLINEVDVDAAADVMEKAAWANTEKDPADFDKDLENAGIY
jgi:hypothetical protein